MSFCQNLAFIPESPFKHDCSPSNSESTGRVRGNLAIWGLLHCISKPREMIWSLLLSYLASSLAEDSAHWHLPVLQAVPGCRASPHQEPTWSPALTVPHLLNPPFPASPQCLQWHLEHPVLTLPSLELIQLLKESQCSQRGERSFSAAIHSELHKFSKQQGLHKRGWGRSTGPGGKSRVSPLAWL